MPPELSIQAPTQETAQAGVISGDAIDAALAEAEAAHQARVKGETPPAEVQQEETAKAVKPEWVEDKFWDAETGQVNAEAMAQSYKELQAKLSQKGAETAAGNDTQAGNRRKARSRERNLETANTAIETARRYADTFGLDWRWEGQEATEARIAAEYVAAVASRRARQAEQEERARIRLEEQRRDDALDFASWRAGGLVRCPHSYATDDAGSVYMRVMGSQLETSRGATVPLHHAVRVFQFIRQCRERGEGFKANGRVIRVGHFTVTEITPQGDMVAGCHRFSWERIAEVAEVAGGPMRPSAGSSARKGLYGSASAVHQASSTERGGRVVRRGASMTKRQVPQGLAGLIAVLAELHTLDENMPVIQGLIFLHVASFAHREQGPGVTEIAAALGLTESRTSRNVNLLEEAGLISKKRDPLNARVRLVEITEKGFSFLERLTSLVTRH